MKNEVLYWGFLVRGYAMVDFSDCYITKVKSFFGFKSIDPPVPIEEFIHKNLKDLKSLIKNNQIIAFDDQGNEIDIFLLKKYIHTSYENMFKKIHLDENNNNNIEKEEDVHDEASYFHDELEKIHLIDAEKKSKIEHKQRLLDSLKECDPRYRKILENGIKRNEKKIEELQEKRRSLLNRDN